MSKRRTVYPVAGTYLAGIPHAPIIAEHEVAGQLVATGAYQNHADGEQPESVELSDEQSALLPFFHNVEVDEQPAEPEAEPELEEEQPAP